MTDIEKTKGALTYLLGFLTGIFFLLTEKESQFIRFHAMQSTITFGGIFIIQMGLSFISFFSQIMLTPLISLLSFILWLVLMWRAYQGEKFLLPWVGELAEKQLKKI